MFFPLQPGSDYAMPDPPNANGLIIGVIPPDSPEFTNSYRQLWHSHLGRQ